MEYKRTNWRKGMGDFMHWFGLVMVAVYLALGIYIITTDSLNYASGSMRYLMAAFFISYGVFRLVRWVLKQKSRKYSDESEENSVL